MQTRQGINWHFTKWVILATRNIFQIVNHDNQKELLKSSMGALAAQWKQLYLAAVWLLQDDWKSRGNSLIFTTARTLLSAFTAASRQECWRKWVLKQRRSFVETCWNRIENTLDQFSSVRIGRFIAFFLIQFEMDRVAPICSGCDPGPRALQQFGLVLLGVFCLDPLYLLLGE